MVKVRLYGKPERCRRVGEGPRAVLDLLSPARADQGRCPSVYAPWQPEAEVLRFGVSPLEEDG